MTAEEGLRLLHELGVGEVDDEGGAEVWRGLAQAEPRGELDDE
jgi:hypothetical protein